MIVPGDYVKFRAMGYDVVMAVDEVSREPGGSAYITGEVSDKHGSEALDPGCPYGLGQRAEVDASSVDRLALADADGEGAIDPEFDVGGGL